MGFLSHSVERSDLEEGDHIYTWRTAYTYSHHGIYVGANKVVHFTQDGHFSSSINSASCFPASSSINPASCFSSGSSNNVPASCFSSSSSINVPASCSPSSSSNNFPASCSPLSSSNNVPASCFSSSSSVSHTPTPCSGILDCGYRKDGSGVIMSCLTCFLGDGSLCRFQYGVGGLTFIAKIRGGTCTTAESDPPKVVVHRAMYLLHKGFRDYDVCTNNCEDFAMYCKTGYLVCSMERESFGGSGQATSVLCAPLAAVITMPLRLLVTNSFNRYATDIGVRDDMVQVRVEDLELFLKDVMRLKRSLIKKVLHVLLIDRDSRVVVDKIWIYFMFFFGRSCLCSKTFLCRMLAVVGADCSLHFHHRFPSYK